MVRVNPIRDNRRAYYTKSDYIVNYMATALELRDGMSVLDPCAGDGALIDGVLGTGCDVRIAAYELDQAEAENLSQKYSKLSKVQVRCCDTLLEATDNLFDHTPRFDRIVANPPYGAWQDYERRKLLKKQFPNLYVRETYGLFLSKCLDLLNDDGRLVFIVPDTYLDLHLHKNLRSRILREAFVEEIVLFPSKFFPNVGFGYANLSIVSLRRATNANLPHNHRIKIIKGLTEPSQLAAILTANSQEAHVEMTYVAQNRILNNHSHAFLVHSDQQTADYINSSAVAIGDIADVVTGFYSGNDKRYLRRASASTPRGKRYQIVNQNFVARGLSAPSLWGIEGPRHFIPIVKGGAKKFLKPTDWFINWSKEAVLDYRIHNKSKARFQNSEFYFREGLAVPMVTSSNITAALLDQRLFDQSIVGVFPKDPGLITYLLGFFNSAICSNLIRAINPSANNSANYVKKVPYQAPTQEQKARVEAQVRKIIDAIRSTGQYDRSDEEQMNAVFEEIYQYTSLSTTEASAPLDTV